MRVGAPWIRSERWIIAFHAFAAVLMAFGIDVALRPFDQLGPISIWTRED